MRPPRRDAGYALLVILLMASLVAISLSAAVPRLLTQGQREKEKELIFRGEQYQRAIGFFFKATGRYPNSIDELLETNDRAFLRRAWADPMTESGEWRIIRVGPGGEFIGSVHQPLQAEPDEQEGEATEERVGDVESLPIAGVASRNRDWSIKVYEGYQRYYEWEFVYDPTEAALGGQPETPTGGSPDESGDANEPADDSPSR